MSLSVRSAGLIRALIYPVQFDENPLEAVDRVIDTVVRARSLYATPDVDDNLNGCIRTGFW